MTTAARANRKDEVRRVAATGVAFLVLLVVARPGSPSWVVTLLFAIFIACATIWLSKQYTDSLDRTRDDLGLGSWAILFAVACALVPLHYLVNHLGQPGFLRSGLGILGVFGAYLLFGDAVSRLRHRKTNRRRLGGIVFGAALLAVVLGAAALRWGSGWLVIAAVLFLAAGITALDEPPDRPLARWVVGGAALTTLTVVLVWLVSGSTPALWPLAVLAILVVAVTSATQADVVIVMSVVALMGVTPVPELQRDGAGSATGGGVLVALGDSYMSGEGASIYYSGTDEAGGNQCRQAPTAWAVLVSQNPQFGDLRMLACSSARTRNLRLDPPRTSAPGVEAANKGLPGPQEQFGTTGTQLQQFLAEQTAPPAMVAIGIGGNDAGFSSIGVMCLAPGDCHRKAGELWEPTLPQVERALRATYPDISLTFPDTPVVVVPYPDPIHLGTDCPDVALSTDEQTYLHRFVAGLNQRISSTADPGNHGRPGVNFLGLRSVRGIAEERFNPANWTHNSLHPNEAGHAAMARAFQSWYARSLTGAKLGPRAPIPGPAATRREAAFDQQAAKPPDAATAEADEGKPICDIYDSDAMKGCRAQGKEWAVQQVGAMLMPFGVVAAVLMTAGAWVLAVGIFAWRRREHRRRRAAGGA